MWDAPASTTRLEISDDFKTCVHALHPACVRFHGFPFSADCVYARDVDETANPDKSAVYDFGRKHKGAALSHKHSCTESYQQGPACTMGTQTSPHTIAHYACADIGNTLFKAGKYQWAIWQYSSAVEKIGDCGYSGEWDLLGALICLIGCTGRSR